MENHKVLHVTSFTIEVIMSSTNETMAQNCHEFDHYILDTLIKCVLQKLIIVDEYIVVLGSIIPKMYSSPKKSEPQDAQHRIEKLLNSQNLPKQTLTFVEVKDQLTKLT